MANSYNTSQTTISSTSSPTTVFTASASTTLIKSIRVMHGSATSTATLAMTKSGGSRTNMGDVSVTADTLTDLINDVLPLSAGDVLTVESTHQPTYVWVSYVENTTSVSGQSIDVLTDVDITTSAPTNGQVLVWNDSANEFQPGDQSSGSGTVTSVGITAGTGISSSGGPVTTSGNITVALNADTHDLTDVASTTPTAGQVLEYDGTRYEPSGKLSTLYGILKEGTSTTLNDGANTNSQVELTGTTAKLKTGITEVKLTETSPGDIEFVVATDASGTTAFTAIHIDGTTTANAADVIIKNGASLKVESASATTANLRYTGTGNANVSLPGSTGTLALTSELYTDSDADARIAAASVTDLTDVTSAGSGAIITSAERTKLTGIAEGAEVNVIDSVLDDTTPQLGGNLDVNGNEIQSTGDVIVRVDSDNNTALSKFVIKDGAGTSIYTIDEEGTTIATTGASNNIKIGNLDGSLGTFNGISLNNNLTYPGIVGFAGGSSSNDFFYLFGEDIDIRAGGASDPSIRITEDATLGSLVVINSTFPTPTTHNFYVSGTGKFTGNVDIGSGVDVTGNITVTGTVDGVDIAAAHAEYEEDELVDGQNVTMNSSVSVASNKIVDIMGNALADKSNANSKKMLGFHTGSGVCVLSGMVDANNSITGASAGSPLWLGASGAFSATAPTTATEYSRIMGYYVGTGQGGEVLVYFDPSKDWVQID